MAYVPPVILVAGHVGVPTFTGMDANKVPDPSPGVMSVLWTGVFGPTPPPDERAKPQHRPQKQ